MIKIKTENKEMLKQFDHKELSDNTFIINKTPTKGLLIDLLLNRDVKEVWYSMDFNFYSNNPLMWTRFE